MLNKDNFLKIVLDVESKPSKNYEFAGKAYYIYSKSEKCLVFNSMWLTKAYKGASSMYRNGRRVPGAKEYIKESNKLWDVRLSAFKSIKGKKQGVVSAMTVKQLNEQLWGETVRRIEGFFVGANATGGIKVPSAVRLRVLNEFKIDGEIVDDPKILPLFSRIVCNKESMSKKFVDSIEEISLTKFVEKFSNKITFIPNARSFLSAYLDKGKIEFVLKEAIIAQNYDKIGVKAFKKNTIDPRFFDETKEDINRQIEILKEVMMQSTHQAKKLSRRMWRKNIMNNMANNKFKRDFVNGTTEFEKAHIIENKQLHVLNDKEIKELISEDNYLLLDAITHRAWDKEKIEINPVTGEIKNKSLDKKSFKRVSGNIYAIYKKSKTDKRVEYLQRRMLFKYIEDTHSAN